MEDSGKTCNCWWTQQIMRAAKVAQQRAAAQRIPVALACQLPTPAEARRRGFRYRSRMESTNTGWPRTTSSPKLVMYASSMSQALDRWDAFLT